VPEPAPVNVPVPVPVPGLSVEEALADLPGAAAAARAAIEEVLGAAVPPDSAAPVAAGLEELETDLAVDLRPRMESRHPGASEDSRELVLRAMARASARSIVARYSATRRRIFVASGNVLPQMEAAGLPRDGETVRAFLTATLAHEMVHAVDDAAVGVEGLFAAAPDAEAGRALGMVLEGRAVHFSRRAAARLGLPRAAAEVLPGGTGPLDERKARFLLTYREGARFIAALEERGGLALASRPLRAPPRSTSTVFHPERYGDGGEALGPDLVPGLVAAGFEGAAAASELDLRARWIPRLGEEAVARAFAGFLSGAGLHRPGGGVSVSLHDTQESALGYAACLETLYRGEGDGGGTRAWKVLRRDRAVGSAVGPSAGEAREETLRALKTVP
jgi:hypothetical protein